MVSQVGRRGGNRAQCIVIEAGKIAPLLRGARMPLKTGPVPDQKVPVQRGKRAGFNSQR